MGKANRQRRAAKQRKDIRTARAQHGSSFAGAGTRDAQQAPPLPHEQVLATIIQAAYQASHEGDSAGFEAALQLLASRPDVGGWRPAAIRAMYSYLRPAITTAWQRGWQPADVARMVTRKLGGSCTRLVRDAIADELEQYASATVDPRWRGQLETIGAARWWPPDQTYLRAVDSQQPQTGWVTVMTDAVQLLCLLTPLAELEQLGPIPGEYRSTPGDLSESADRPEVDEKILARIRALLAKAEATTSEAEAEAFTAGAQERMARYSIDHAMLAASDPRRAQAPSGRRIGVENPYEASKAVLLDRVAQANRCRSVWSKEFGFCTVVGFESDLAAVETLFTSLLVQAVTAMTRAGKVSGARARSKSFRQSFLIAYASRIGERLAEVTTAQAQAASAEPGGGNVLPVLASRDLAVEQARDEMFPRLVAKSAGNVTDGAGWQSGRQAADQATLQARTSVEH